MNARTVRIALASALALLAANVRALDVPAWSGPVNDGAGVMSAEEKASLGEYLSAVNSQTGVQVGVLTVPSLEGESIESFSMRVAESWKLGSADKDNGAILVVSIADRDLRIEVGYGLEETLTDLKCGLIIRNVIVPEFKAGDYGAGIVAGAKSIVGVATGEVAIADDGARGADEASGASSDAGGVGMVFAIVLFMILRFAMMGRRRSRGGLGGFLGPFLLGSALSSMNRNSGSGWTNRSSGFGGGGFSGGGGGFGGGGASGHW
jgi:uncharacterized protein